MVVVALAVVVAMAVAAVHPAPPATVHGDERDDECDPEPVGGKEADHDGLLSSTSACAPEGVGGIRSSYGSRLRVATDPAPTPRCSAWRRPVRAWYYGASSMDESPVGPDGSRPWSRRVEVLLATAAELTVAHDLEGVLQRIADGAAEVASARYAAVGIYDASGAITTFVHHGVDDATAARIGALPKGRGLLGAVIIADEPVRIEDLGSDPRACGFPPGHPPMRTFLGVPVMRAGRRYGNLYLTEKAGGAPFDRDDEALVVALATFAAGAIESAELMRSERERAEALARLDVAEERARVRREMLGEVITAQEAERARVARDLHDDVGQALTSVLLGLRLVDDSLAGEAGIADARRRTEDLRELVADALRGARRLAFDLRPTVLDDVGLAPALLRLAENTTTRSGVEVHVATPGVDADVRFRPDLETVVYRVVQEALTNVVRHASATSVAVTVSLVHGTTLRALVEDDGVGFDVDGALVAGRLGLRGMMERAELVGGSVVVTSGDGSGTTVVLEVPVG